MSLPSTQNINLVVSVIRGSTLRLPSTPRNLPVLELSQGSADLVGSYVLLHLGLLHGNRRHVQIVCPHALSVMPLNARLVLVLGWFKRVGEGITKGGIKPQNLEPVSSENHLCCMRVITTGDSQPVR